MDIRNLLEVIYRTGAFGTVVNNPLAQFGTPQTPLLGATLMPERLTNLNEYSESGIRFRSVIANAGTRFSPVQIKQGGALMGSFRVSLGNSDIGAQLTAADYEGFLQLLNGVDESGVAAALGGQSANGPAGVAFDEATMRLLNWVEVTLNRPLVQHNEKNRWDAIVNAEIILTGDNNYREQILLPNPTGSRVAAGGSWSDDAYDPMDDILAGLEYFAEKGYTVARMICGTPVRSMLLNNENIRTRGTGTLVVQPGGTVGQVAQLRVSSARLNEMFGEEGLPALEIYDTTYRTQNTSGYYLARNAFVMIGATDAAAQFTLGDANVQPIAPAIEERLARGGVIGYLAVGRAAGQNAPGRVIKTRVVDDRKPPGIHGEAWQTSLPIPTDPDAVFVITDID